MIDRSTKKITLLAIDLILNPVMPPAHKLCKNVFACVPEFWRAFEDSWRLALRHGQWIWWRIGIVWLVQYASGGGIYKLA